MDRSSDAIFQSDEWIVRLRRYAANLIQCLRNDLTAVNGMGVELHAKHRRPLTILPQRCESLLNSQEQSGAVHQSSIDRDFLDQWLKQPIQSTKALLLLGPFGSGKSVALAHFALTLADRLCEWCDSEAKSEYSMPWVPFPVRLRGMGENSKLWDYMVAEAQADINPQLRKDEYLTPGDLHDLRDRGRLLPLFDGLDEVAEYSFDERTGNATAPRAAVINEIASSWCSTHHILTSRPGYGAESGSYAAAAMIAELGEMNLREAEAFMHERLLPQQHWVLERFRAIQPSVGDLFRRPLFLAAWCQKAKSLDSTHVPTTISELMDVLLAYVFDVRLSDHQSGEDRVYSRLKQELLDHLHVLGAILAVHAHDGFGQCVSESALLSRSTSHADAIPDHDTFRRYSGFLRKSGLLIQLPRGTKVMKTPPSEYLIARYYAWRTRSDSFPTAALPGSPAALVRAFQQQFWWSDHREVWSFMFDLLWNGTLPQVKLAAGLVEWVVELTHQCNQVADWPGVGSASYEHQPMFLCHFALVYLLPNTGVPPEVARILDPIARSAFQELMNGVQRNWFWLYSREQSSVLFKRWGRLFVEWSIPRLSKREPADHQNDIAKLVSDASAALQYQDVLRLVELFFEHADGDIRKNLGDAVSVGIRLLSSKQLDSLLRDIKEQRFDSLWPYIASGVGEACRSNGGDAVSVLMQCLTDQACAHSWRTIADEIERQAVFLKREDVTALVRCFRTSAYQGCLKSLAGAITSAKHHLGADEFEAFAECLARPDYQPVWEQLVVSVGDAPSQLIKLSYIDAFVQLLTSKYGQDYSLELATCSGLVTMICRRGVAALRYFLEQLTVFKSEYQLHKVLCSIHRAAPDLVCSVSDALAWWLVSAEHSHVWGKVALTIKVFDLRSHEMLNVLLRCLTDRQYRHAWSEIASAVAANASLLTVADLNRLCTCIKSNEYGDGNGEGGILDAFVQCPFQESATSLLLDALHDRNVTPLQKIEIAQWVWKIGLRDNTACFSLVLACFKGIEYEEEWNALLSAFYPISRSLNDKQLGILKELAKNTVGTPANHYVSILLEHAMPKEQHQPVVPAKHAPQSWPQFPSLIQSLHSGLSEAALKSVLNEVLHCFRYESYGSFWHKAIAAVSNLTGRSATVAADELIQLLNDSSYYYGWPTIAECIECLADDLQQRHLLEILRLLPLDYSWETDGYLVERDHRFAMRAMVCAAVKMAVKNGWPLLQQLFLYLGTAGLSQPREIIEEQLSKIIFSPELVENVKVLADEAAARRELKFVERLFKACPGLVLFISDVQTRPAGKGTKQAEAKTGLACINFGVRLRHDGDLLLNFRFAPPAIQHMLNPAPLPTGEGSEQYVQTQKVIQIVIGGVFQHIPPTAAADFNVKWSGRGESRTTRDRQLMAILQRMLREIRPSDRKNFCRRGRACGIRALRDAKKGSTIKPVASKDDSSGKHLEVSSRMLNDLIRGNLGVELMQVAYDIVVKHESLTHSWKDLEDPSYDCPRCGRLFLACILNSDELVEDDLSDEMAGDEESPDPPEMCDVCRYKFNRTTDLLDEMPPVAEIKLCRSNKDRSFRSAPRGGGDWQYSLRNIEPNYCPCQECRNKRSKWRAPSAAI
jgi:hypothetical protein